MNEEALKHENSMKKVDFSEKDKKQIVKNGLNQRNFVDTIICLNKTDLMDFTKFKSKGLMIYGEQDETCPA